MKITNKKAHFDYELQEALEAGINLFGSEAKAVRLGRADLTGSYVKIIGSEVYLVNATISPYQSGQIEGYDEKRTRKLLLHKKEILALKSKLQSSNLALVPVSLYFKHGFAKLEIALGKGKRKFEKKRTIKKMDLERDLEAELSNRS
jgi:SsrA-binding protein